MKKITSRSIPPQLNTRTQDKSFIKCTNLIYNHEILLKVCILGHSNLSLIYKTIVITPETMLSELIVYFSLKIFTNTKSTLKTAKIQVLYVYTNIPPEKPPQNKNRSEIECEDTYNRQTNPIRNWQKYYPNKIKIPNALWTHWKYQNENFTTKGVIIGVKLSHFPQIQRDKGNSWDLTTHIHKLICHHRMNPKHNFY